MSEFYDTSEKRERVILIAVSTSDNDDTQSSLSELSELARTAGAETVGRIIQNREAVHPGTYIGKGKIEELKDAIALYNANGVIADDELSPAQLKNLENELDVKVLDRTALILDIFALHATTSEGKIQVELAQLKYRSSRLIGMKNFSRLGGGIGTRGPGESKLEEDKRQIRDRIARLNDELKNVVKTRELTRKQREKSNVPVVAIVGYTNAGKSTLLNKLTDASVLEENKLFATLDPTTRSYTSETGQQILFTDTVGFIRKLPHHLIDAFKSTLEEAKYADVILHVVDASNPDAEKQMHVVYQTLAKLGIEDKPVVTALNKYDLCMGSEPIKDLKAEKCVQISARYGDNTDLLISVIDGILKAQKVYVDRLFTYSEAGKIQIIRKYGQLISEDYEQDGIHVKAYVPKQVSEGL